MNNLDADFIALVDDCLDNGSLRKGRNGDATSVFGRMIRHDMRDGFPLITTRRVSYKGVFGELAGFLEGATTEARFAELGCPYWKHNAFPNGELGPIYGAQWRDFNGVDQLETLINGLHTNPYGRRHVLTTWNPADLPLMCLPPCHLLAQFFRGRDGSLSCSVYMRSVDLCLGLPSDLVLYGLLLALVAKEVGAWPKDLVFFLGDAHVYENHEELWVSQRVRRIIPTYNGRLDLDDSTTIFEFLPEQAVIRDYKCHDTIKYPLN